MNTSHRKYDRPTVSTPLGAYLWPLAAIGLLMLCVWMYASYGGAL